MGISPNSWRNCEERPGTRNGSGCGSLARQPAFVWLVIGLQWQHNHSIKESKGLENGPCWWKKSQWKVKFMYKSWWGGENTWDEIVECTKWSGFPFMYKIETKIQNRTMKNCNFCVKIKKTWRCRGSNPVPLACKASALPFELHPLDWDPRNIFKYFVTENRRWKIH